MSEWKEDNIYREFTGTTYKLDDVKTVGQLKERLENILEDIRDVDGSLEIKNLTLYPEDGSFEYSLKEPIPQ